MPQGFGSLPPLFGKALRTAKPAANWIRYPYQLRSGNTVEVYPRMRRSYKREIRSRSDAKSERADQARNRIPAKIRPTEITKRSGPVPLASHGYAYSQIFPFLRGLIFHSHQGPNLHLTLLDKVGVHLDSFADSKGKVDELFEPLGI